MRRSRKFNALQQSILEPVESRFLFSKIIYVDAHASGATLDGESWSTAFVDLQQALSGATVGSGDEIRIADGVYKATTTTNRSATFALKSGVTLKGGYSGFAASDPNARDLSLYLTILSGDIGVAGNKSDNSFHVVTGSNTDATAILDGVTVTAGNADAAGTVNATGAGLYNLQGSPTIRNCIFTGNSATSLASAGIFNNQSSPTISDCTFVSNKGVGVVNSNVSSPTFTNCTFASNTDRGMSNEGGGTVTVTNSSFNGNTSAADGAAISSLPGGSPKLVLTLQNCVFNGNTASSDGGALYFAGNVVINLTHCTFSDNMAGQSGGAIYQASSTSANLVRCTFVRNSATNSGGAILSRAGVTINSCVFNGNSAGGFGGGISSSRKGFTLTNSALTGNTAGVGGALYFASLSTSMVLSNCTITSNKAAIYGGGVGSEQNGGGPFRNCIIWGNAAPIGSQLGAEDSESTVTFSDIEGGYAGVGNLQVAPQFARAPSAGADGFWGTADDDYGDLRLQSCSPVADAGNNSFITAEVTQDLSGNNRCIDILTTPDTGVGSAPLVDMGAYEAQPGLSAGTNGPLYVIQGQSASLNGFGVSDLAGSLSYEWEWTGDGLFDDAVGAAQLFSTAGLPLGVRTIAVRVTDSSGRTATSVTTLQILPGVLYVDSRATGTNDGSNWANAVQSLATAMNASIPGMRINVATGTYKAATMATDRTATFILRSGVQVFGGYAGLGASNPNLRDSSAFPTILSGDIDAGLKATGNSYHVVISGADNTATLDGFTVRDGNADGPGLASRGGGLYLLKGSPNIANCTFTVNSAEIGAGIFSQRLCSPTITNCDFISNLTTGPETFGGGFFNGPFSAPKLTNCAFRKNSATYGGGMIDSGNGALLIDCRFSENEADDGGALNTGGTATLIRCNFYENRANDGAGIMNSGSLLLKDCTFSRNVAAHSGGALYDPVGFGVSEFTGCIFTENQAFNGGGIYTFSSSSPILSNCFFMGNFAKYDGGGYYNGRFGSPTMRNCVFVNNVAGGKGGGFHSADQGSPKFINCTLTGNTAGVSGGGIYNARSTTFSIQNSIIWENMAPLGSQIYQPVGTMTVTYSDVQGGFVGTGNINADPRFVRTPTSGVDRQLGTPDDDYGNLRVLITSPVIDAGNNTAVPADITNDAAGNVRFVDFPGVRDPGAVVDMGTYERVAPFADVSIELNGSLPAIKVTFNGDVLISSLETSDLVLVNRDTGLTVDPTAIINVSYDAPSRTATWTFMPLLPDGNYTAILASNNFLDTNSAPIISQDLLFDFFLLAGDFNRDRRVDANDLSVVAANWQGFSRTFSQGDANYDGRVDIRDLYLVANSWQKTLAPPPQPAPASAATAARVPLRRTPVRVASVLT